MQETNRYHFVDATVDVAPGPPQAVAWKVDGIQGARDVQRLRHLALPDAAALTARRVARGLPPDTPAEAVLTADEARLKDILGKHDLPEDTVIRQLDRVRRRVQFDQDPKQGHDEIDLTKPLPKSMPGEIRRAIHLCIEYKDGRTEIKPPAITASAARRALSDARANPDVARAYVAMRIVTEEDATGEL